jgi:hypothetical protein
MRVLDILSREVFDLPGFFANKIASNQSRERANSIYRRQLAGFGEKELAMPVLPIQM